MRKIWGRPALAYVMVLEANGRAAEVDRDYGGVVLRQLQYCLD